MAAVPIVAGGAAGDALSCCVVVVSFVAGAVSVPTGAVTAVVGAVSVATGSVTAVVGAVSVATAGMVTNNGSAVVSVTSGAASLSAGITVAGGGVMPLHAERPFGREWHCHEPAACNVVHVTDSRAHSTSRAGKRILMSVKTGRRTGCVTISDV